MTTRTTKAPAGLTDEQRQAFYAEQRANREAKANARAGLPADASWLDRIQADVEQSTKVRADERAQRDAAIAAGTLVPPAPESPFTFNEQPPRRGAFTSDDEGEHEYRTAMRVHLGWMMHLDGMREAHGLTDAQIDAADKSPEDKEHLRELRDLARLWVTFFAGLTRSPEEQAARYEAWLKSDEGRAVEALLNPTDAQVKTRMQQNARDARRDPRRVHLQNAKKNHKRALEGIRRERARIGSAERLLADWPSIPPAERYYRVMEHDAAPKTIREARQAIEELTETAGKWAEVVEAIEAEFFGRQAP